MPEETSMTRIPSLGLALALVALPVAALAGDHGAVALNWLDFSDREQAPLFAYFFNFAALVVLLAIFVRKPVARALAARRQQIVTAIDEARELARRAEERMARVRAAEQLIDVELAKLRDDILAGGRRESDRVRQQARVQAERLRADVQSLLAFEASRLADTLRDELVARVTRRAEERLLRALGPADDERLVRDFLGHVKSPAANPPAARV